MLPTRIYFTGFMGCGKSTIGQLVANVLGYDFVDLDRMIEAEDGRTVAEIFEAEGEAGFREREAAALRRTGQRMPLVVACGGGALVNEANLYWALAHGTVVYLRVPARQLVLRIRHGRSRRPLMLDAEGKVLPLPELRKRIDGLLARRKPFYRRAHLTIDVGNRYLGQTVDYVVQQLRRYGRRHRRKRQSRPNS